MTGIKVFVGVLVLVLVNVLVAVRVKVEVKVGFSDIVLVGITEALVLVGDGFSLMISVGSGGLVA